ncbi:MAG: LytTR family DNA-binding domain-containing protein [Flavobacteriales bacterium]|nr:LytTR family DNA-binding domain-containing protein [Flavobacteriales bacterium]
MKAGLSPNIKSIIVDDEEDALINLQNALIKYCPSVQIIASCKDIEEAYHSISTLKPDLVFLDIDLGSKTSFELLDLLKPIDFKVIFVTGHQDYAIKAFKYSAVDYILKPVSGIELMPIIEKIIQETEHRDKLNFLSEQLQQKSIPDRIALNTGKHVVFVELKDIEYLKADERYVLCHLNDGNKIHVNRSIREFEDLLPEQFYRVHKSYMINLDFIVKLESREVAEVELKSGVVVPIAHKRKKDFYDFLQKKYGW